MMMKSHTGTVNHLSGSEIVLASTYKEQIIELSGGLLKKRPKGWLIIFTGNSWSQSINLAQNPQGQVWKSESICSTSAPSDYM
jgi:hypothetical protein